MDVGRLWMERGAGDRDGDDADKVPEPRGGAKEGHGEGLGLIWNGMEWMGRKGTREAGEACGTWPGTWPGTWRREDGENARWWSDG